MTRKKIKKYSEFIGMDSNEFKKRNILDPTINSDIPLFIDPRLLKYSQYEIFHNASITFDEFYSELATMIRYYIKIHDTKTKQKMQKSIIKKLSAPEPNALCLGYSKNDNNGQGVGRVNAKLLFDNAVEIYTMLPTIGSTVFSLLGLLTEGIGADYIGDITANIIWKELCCFTENISEEMKINVREYILNDHKFYLPMHPNATEKNNFPILFVPKDILTDLPKDADFEYVFNGYTNENEGIRDGVNDKISEILKSALKKADKQKEIFKLIKENGEKTEDLIKYLKSVKGKVYNYNSDPRNIFLRENVLGYLSSENLKIREQNELRIIDFIIKKFENFIRHNNKLKRELLWNNNKCKGERAWQQVFHTYIEAFLSSNDIDIIPERETQSGPVDFCFSKGNKLRVLVELKLSTNNPGKGLANQLERYKECMENVKTAYFICFNVHKDKSSQKILEELSEIKRDLGLETNIIVINGKIEQSASNL